MADLSTITLPSGTTYNLKDAEARELIDALTSATSWLGVTTTALTDGATTNPITVGGESVTAAEGDIASYGSAEFIFNGSAWQEFGDLSALGALAYKDSATGNITPAGTVSQPTFTGTKATLTLNSTPDGTVEISTGSGTANYTPAGTVTQPTFTGSEMTATGTFTPTGNVSKPNVTVTPTTATVNSITDVGTLPSLTYTVSNENLAISWNAGSLPTKGSDTSVMTGATAALASTPTFTGTAGTVTAKGTPAGTVSQPVFNGTGVDLEASFTGTQETLTTDYTPAGTVSQPTFTGTQGTVTVS